MKNRQQTNTNQRNLLYSKGSFVWPIIPFVGQNRPYIRPFVGLNQPLVCIWTFSRGFTLVELMITLVVAGVLLTLGVPSFQSFLMNNRMVSQANEVVGSLAYARSEAIKRATNVTVCKSDDLITPACQDPGASWATGRLIFIDDNGDGIFDAATDQVLRVHETLTGGNTMVAGQNIEDAIVYSRMGLATLLPGGGAEPEDFEFRLCDTRGTASGRTITISVTGRPSISRGGNGC